MTAVLDTLDRPSVSSAGAAAAAAPAPRLDMYAQIHKALRAFMSDTLARVGRLDPADAADREPTLDQLDLLLDVCLGHLQLENDFLHTTIEARQPAGSVRIAGEHVEHLEHIDALRDESAALRRSDAATAPVLALRLYRHLALFVADNFQHMHYEETAHNAILWAHYSDAELLEIEHRLIATIAPAKFMTIARWMVPASNPAERARMLGGARMGMPPEAFAGLLGALAPHVDVPGWSKLIVALERAGGPLAVAAAAA